MLITRKYFIVNYLEFQVSNIKLDRLWKGQYSIVMFNKYINVFYTSRYIYK